MNQDEMLKRLQSTLPPGRAWTRHPDAEFTKLLKGPATVLADTHSTVERWTVDEPDPSKTTDMIEDWEGFAKPYQDGESPPASLPDRRAAVVRKLKSKGSSTLDDLEELRDLYGYTATFERFVLDDIFTCVSLCNAILYTQPWLSVILVHATAQNPDDDRVFEAAVKQRAQGHVIISFIWT